MRQRYPVSSKEMLGELRDIQETLMSLIGYDSNAFDDYVDISGSIDTMETAIDASGFAFVNSRLYDAKEYESFYKNNLVLYYVRRSLND